MKNICEGKLATLVVSCMCKLMVLSNSFINPYVGQLTEPVPESTDRRDKPKQKLR
jgi:hypothetical protein